MLLKIMTLALIMALAGPFIVLTAQGAKKASIRITKSTKLQRQGGKETLITFEDLKSGLKAEAAFVGPVAESYPVQANAGCVTILR